MKGQRQSQAKILKELGNKISQYSQNPGVKPKDNNKPIVKDKV